jgi:hypothetical protein
MMLDAFQPEGITKLAVDSIFMMPQLGVLSEVHAKAATEVFNKDCLIHLGSCVAPAGEAVKEGKSVLEYKIEMPGGNVEQGSLLYGQMKLIKLGLGDDGLPLKAKANLHPARGLDIGKGKGNSLTTDLTGGVVGIILDGRGRPFDLPTDAKTRVAKLKEWMLELDIYPRERLEKL